MPKICQKKLAVVNAALEPGTSVVRWVRYDGTLETLPESGQKVLVSRSREHNCNIALECLEPEIHIGDFWAYLPEPLEGKETVNENNERNERAAEKFAGGVSE